MNGMPLIGKVIKRIINSLKSFSRTLKVQHSQLLSQLRTDLGGDDPSVLQVDLVGHEDAGQGGVVVIVLVAVVVLVLSHPAFNVSCYCLDPLDFTK